MSRNVNGPTPSEFSFGRGARPSMDLYPQPDEQRDPLAIKRAILQTDSTDPGAPLDFDGTYKGKDTFGRDLPTLRERGHAPIVRESGRGEMDQRLDPTNPKLYEGMHGKGADPNENWRNSEIADPIREGWENGNYDPNINNETTAARYGTDPEKQFTDKMISELTKKRRAIKRTPPSKHPLHKYGEPDPREKP